VWAGLASLYFDIDIPFDVEVSGQVNSHAPGLTLSYLIKGRLLIATIGLAHVVENIV
jgi:hypothetical protein